MVEILWHYLENNRHKEKTNQKMRRAQTMKKTFGMMATVMFAVLLIGTFIVTEHVTAGETSKGGGRFIAYSNGTVLDTGSGLMWAAKDNGSDINWQDARSYCQNYQGGGYIDWRMPTLDELAGLYDAGKSRPSAYNREYSIHIATELIDITHFAPWASETSGSTAANFNFYNGTRNWSQKSDKDITRALPVRNTK